MKVNWQTRLSYWIDNYMARGTKAMVGGLAILSLIVVVIVASILVFGKIPVNESGNVASFFEASWIGLVRTLDPGIIGGDHGIAFRFVTFFATLAGIFIISTLIGVIANAVEDKMKELRKGHSKVIENDHIVILGWSSQIFCVIKELVTESKGTRRKVVILCDKDKVSMEEEILRKIGSKDARKVICRTGSPLDYADLQMVSIQTSKSIIILSPEIDNPDAIVIKTILAVTHEHRERSTRHLVGEIRINFDCNEGNAGNKNTPASSTRETPYHIVAEIEDPKNLNAASAAGKGEVRLLFTQSVISRIIAQTCMQSGLSVVYEELLDFNGVEMYTSYFPQLRGKSFKEAIMLFRDSTLIGICDETGSKINPPMGTIITDADKMIVISENQFSSRLSESDDIECTHQLLSSDNIEHRKKENILILGWNDKVPMIVDELAEYVPLGSKVTIISKHCIAESEKRKHQEALKKLVVNCIEDDVTSWSALNDIDIQEYNSVIVLPNNDRSLNDPDANTLITLLHIREKVEEKAYSPQIVSEIIDIRNKQLAEVAKANDFIVSERLISLLLTQNAVNKDIGDVFDDIFDANGSEIYLKDVKEYVKLGAVVNFRTVIEAACSKNQVAIGYRLNEHSDNPGKNFGIILNPKKEDMVSFTDGDKVVVISED